MRRVLGRVRKKYRVGNRVYRLGEPTLCSATPSPRSSSGLMGRVSEWLRLCRESEFTPLSGPDADTVRWRAGRALPDGTNLAYPS